MILLSVPLNALFLFGATLFHVFMHQSIPAAPSPPPRATAGHLPAFSVPGWGICKFCAARGPGICQPRGNFRAFDTLAVSYQDRGLWRHVLDFMHAFLQCLSTQNYIAKIGKPSTWINVFWLVNQFSFDIIWRTSFHIYNLFITYNFRALY